MVIMLKDVSHKWCPLSRVMEHGSTVTAGPVTAINRGSHRVMLSSRCMGDSCAAWRWFDVAKAKDANGELLGENRRGYCGMAGHPSTE